MIPETSTTLLRNITDADSVRWPEFVSRYRPMMTAYLASHFPALDADDMIQETFVALFNVLPRYRYDPDETGRFRNYLTGILRKRALKQCEKADKDRMVKNELQKGLSAPSLSRPSDGHDDVLLDDDRIPDKSKQIFQRLTVDGVAPDMVAKAYGTSRNNVDKTKSRMIARLREIVRTLEEAGDG